MDDVSAYGTEALEREIQALQGSRILLDAIPVPIFFKNAAGVYLGCNSAFEAYLGRQREEVIGRTVYGISPKHLADIYRAADDELLARGGVQTYESRVRYGDGTEHDVVLYKATFSLPDGTTGGLIGTILDITERKRIEHALREREQRLADALGFNERVIAAVSVGIIVYKASGQCVLANEAAARAIGGTLEQVRGQNLRELDSWHRSGLLRSAEEALASGEGATRSTHVVTSFGKDVWLDYRFIPFSAAGELHLLFMFDDITERKRMERDLLDSRERYQRQAEELEVIYRRAPIGLAVFDRELRYKRVNDRLAEINGLPADAHLGKTPREVIPSLADVSEELARRIFTTGDAVLDFELRGETPAQPGVDRVWNEHLLPLKDETGFVWGINVVVEEVTERKRMESIRRREREFRALTERSPDVVSRYDRDMRFLYVNPAIEKSTGRMPGFFIGKRIQEAGLPKATESLWVEHVAAVFESGQEGAMEFSYPVPNGSEAHFDTFLIPECGPDGEVETVIAVTRDITERKRADAELRQAYASLERTLVELRDTQQQVIQSEKLSALGALAAGVAHELNNPLMGVMGYVGLAAKRMSEPEGRKILERAAHELERMRDLLKNMLGFARPIEEQLGPVRPGEVLERALALMLPELKTRGVDVSKEVPPDLPVIMAKEGALQQVFVNLLMNARDALEGRERPRIRIVGRREKDRLVIEVADTGTGVPKALQEKIFDPFVTTKPPGKGTGLGLSISRNILTDLGGALTLTSEEGKGATFTVLLPIGQPPG